MNDAEGLLIVGGVAVVGFLVYEAVKTVDSITNPLAPGGVIGPISPPAPQPGIPAPHNPYGTDTYKGHKWHAVKNKSGHWVWAAGPAPSPHKAPKKVAKTPPKTGPHPKAPAKAKTPKAPVRAKSPGKLVAL